MPAYTRFLLLARGTGFHFGAPPPDDLLRPRYLESNVSKEVIAAVLAHARLGNFGVFDHLLRLMQRDNSAVTWNACANLLSYAAPYSVIRKLNQITHDEVYVRRDGGSQYYACRILSGCKGLWCVPEMLDIFFLVKDRTKLDNIPFYLSYLLEEERGPIADGPAVIEKEANESYAYLLAEEYDDAAYRSAVLAKYDELKSSVSGDSESRIAIFEGAVLSLESVARKLLARLRADGNFEEIEIGRMTFEAFTGINCSSFYNPETDVVQPLAAAAVVEEFLDTGDAAKYEPGVRYFFGHPIPD